MLLYVHLVLACFESQGTDHFSVLPTRVYHNMEEVNSDYESGALHPSDLKSNLSKAINKILQVFNALRKKMLLVCCLYYNYLSFILSGYSQYEIISRIILMLRSF